MSWSRRQSPVQADGPNYFEPDVGLPFRRFTARPMWAFGAEQQCATRVLGELRETGGLQELDDLDHALAADDVIGPRTEGDSVISAGAGGGSWQRPSLIHGLVDDAVKSAPAFILSPSARDTLTAIWAAWLRRPADQVTAVMALGEFDVPDTVLPIEIEPGLEIVKLSDEELAASLTFGGGVGSLNAGERSVHETLAIRTSFASQLFINDIQPDVQERELGARQKADDLLASVLLALRVFRAGRVRGTGAFHYVITPQGVSPRSGSVGPMFGWHAADAYALAAADVDTFRAFWTTFKKGRQNALVESALRRFNYAAERRLPEDAIVDLMIAAETLFLSETAPLDRGELRYRLATRVAALLGSTTDERLQLLKFARVAYDARSTIVHGDSPRPNRIKNLNGDTVTLEVLAQDIESVLRRALQAAVDYVANQPAFPPSWDQLILGGPPA